MRFRWGAAAITMLLFIGVGLLAFALNEPSEAGPAAKRGIIAIDGGLLERQTVALNGEWEVYPGRLLSPDDFRDGRAEPFKQYIEVPNSWSRQTIRGGKAEPFRYGTYRLIVQLDEARLIGLKTGEIRSSHKLYIDGKLVGQAGDPSGDSSYVPNARPYAAIAQLEHRTAEVIVQVANFDLARGTGIQNAILLGTPGKIMQAREKALSFDWIFTATLLIISLYFVGLYHKLRQDVYVLWMSLFCLGAALFTLTHGEQTIYSLVPGIGFAVLVKLQYISGFSAIFALLLHICHSFPELSPAGAVKRFAMGYAAVMAGIVALPVPLVTGGDAVVTAVALFYVLYVVYILVSGIMQKYEGSLFMAATVVVILFQVVSSLYNVENAGREMEMAPIVPFIGILGLSLLMSGRYANAFLTIKRLSERLIATDRLKDEFLTKTSHEFRTPLHGIMNIAQSLADRIGSLSADQQRERLALITTTAKRLSTLVYDIMDLSRLKQGNLRVEKSAVDVRSSVTVVLEVFRYIAQDGAVSLVNDVDPRLPPVLVDENRLRQMLSNLVDNALKHADSRLITVSAEREGEMIGIRVTDNGCGMPEQLLANLAASPEGSGDGLGIGLAICRQLTELHGGTLTIRSATGEGTTVTISLPVAYGETGLAPEATPGLPAEEAPFRQPAYPLPVPQMVKGGKEMTILAVDDDLTNLNVLVELLGTEGYSVIAARNGQEALERLQPHVELDLVILDVMMPGMSGHEVCVRLRERYSLSELPVLMLTAAVHPDDVTLAFQSGANDFLNKPFDKKQFLMRIQSLLSTKRSAQLARRMELAFLQAQIKPHFIDNVLNTITALSYEDVEEARTLIQYVSQFLRSSFSFQNSDKFLPLEKELAFVHAYYQIEKYRFEERVELQLHVPDDAQVQLPPLILQPIVENAIRHGLSPKLEGGTIAIHVQSRADGVIIEVKDDGVGMDPSAADRLLHGDDQSSSVGLRNINRRLLHAFGTELRITSAPGLGTSVSLFIPASSFRHTEVG